MGMGKIEHYKTPQKYLPFPYFLGYTTLPVLLPVMENVSFG